MGKDPSSCGYAENPYRDAFCNLELIVCSKVKKCPVEDEFRRTHNGSEKDKEQYD